MNSPLLRPALLTCLFVLHLFTSYVSFAKDGGSMDGGGGSGTEVLRVKPELTANLYNKEKPLLFVFLNIEINKLTAGITNDKQIPEHIASKFFNSDLSDSKIHDKIQSLKIDFLTDRPCHDLYSSPVDGSIYPSNSSFDICISAFNLSRRYSARDYNEQLLGLVLHEASHLLGATEEEAQSLQKLFISKYEELKKEKNKMSYVYKTSINALASINFIAGNSISARSSNGIWLCDFFKKSPYKLFKNNNLADLATEYNLLPHYIALRIYEQTPVSIESHKAIIYYCNMRESLAHKVYDKSLPLIIINKSLASKINEYFNFSENELLF